MALNYKNFANTAADNIKYSWIGDSIKNPTWVEGAADPTIAGSTFDPSKYYYWKPTSLDLNINNDFTQLFYAVVNQSPNLGIYTGNKKDNIPNSKDWQQNPTQPIVNQEVQIDKVVNQWSSVIDFNKFNKTVTWAYLNEGFLALDPTMPNAPKSSGRTYIGGGVHQ